MDTQPDHLRSAIVVDDEALIRLDACTILEDAGYDAHEAANADEALAILEACEGRVGLLFTDVDMPNGSMDGFALAREVARRWAEIGILVASGRRTPEPDDMPAGTMFVPKPFSGEVVHDRLRQLLPTERQPDPLRTAAGT